MELITSNVTGAFTNKTFTTGGYTFTADYTTNPGFFDVDVAVPEPSTWVCVVTLGALATIVGRRQRRRVG